MGVATRAVGMTKSKLPPPPPPPPLPRWSNSKSMNMSVTKREIEKFWRKKRLVEEDHLLAAIKAAARRRATHLSEQDYMLFMESLEEDVKGAASASASATLPFDINPEIRVGIQDWWTKSKYAYLNQPAVGSTSKPSRQSNYIPNKMCLCNYNYNYNYKICNYKASPAAATA